MITYVLKLNEWSDNMVPRTFNTQRDLRVFLSTKLQAYEANSITSEMLIMYCNMVKVLSDLLKAEKSK